MTLAVSNTEREPHIAAIKLTLDCGYTFTHERTFGDVGLLEAIRAERHHDGLVDTYTLHGPTEAVAARYTSDAYPDGEPIWQKHGSVADVVLDLLSLPPTGKAPDPLTRQAYGLLFPGDE